MARGHARGEIDRKLDGAGATTLGVAHGPDPEVAKVSSCEGSRCLGETKSDSKLDRMKHPNQHGSDEHGLQTARPLSTFGLCPSPFRCLEVPQLGVGQDRQGRDSGLQILTRELCDDVAPIQKDPLASEFCPGMPNAPRISAHRTVLTPVTARHRLAVCRKPCGSSGGCAPGETRKTTREGGGD